MTYTIRPFKKDDADITLLNAVYNAMYPDYAETVEETRHGEDVRDPNYFHHREIIEENGKPIAVGTVMQSPWSFHPQKYFWGVLSVPECDRYAVTRFHYEHTLKHTLADKDMIALTTSARENQEFRLRLLEEEGFVFTMRFPHSELDVDSFDAGKFAHKLQQTRDAGMEIFDLVEMQKREPENWQSILHELCWDVEQDVPNPDAIQKQSLEQFVKAEFESPGFFPEGWFVAHDGKDYVGITMLFKNDMTPDKLWTGLTGTARSARRKGVATSLKVTAIEYARGYGAKRIEADNEENNPMFQINLQLGFKPIPAWMDFEKPINNAIAETTTETETETA